MKIKKLYKELQNVPRCGYRSEQGCNFFVGDIDSGKSTLLEIIQVLLSGRLINLSFERQLKASFFNYATRSTFKEAIADPAKPIFESAG
ncbi:hypothetical protein [Paenibacillus sp. sgz302251]|uniref:hypothetical protein n=1 Tax=Paenibacillus sp. sgz302251 TaxID=3414493 RepID=UPI003C7D8ACB